MRIEFFTFEDRREVEKKKKKKKKINYERGN